MKKKILLALVALPMIAPFIASCSALHVHTINSPYETDETSHWKTCSICHEKFDQHAHVFNEIDDKCFICDYVDPLVYVDENNQVTGLTPYGRTKYTVNLPENVKSIGHEAFKDSDAVTVKLNEGLEYYYVDSFSNSHVKTVTTEEAMVKWNKPDSLGRIFKENISNKVAKIGDEYYSTLQEAFEAVDNDDTTITLLKDRYDLLMNEPIEVDYTIILESLYDNTMLSCHFDIADNGIVYVPDTVVYEGNARLLLTVVKEVRGNGYTFEDYGNVYEDAYSSGSIVFVNKDECPIGANVVYVKSFREIGITSGYPAIGARQVANELLLIPHKHFAFGTVRFSGDFATIKGLTKYGLTVTDLTLTSPIKGKKVEIGQNAFAVGWEVKITIPISFVDNIYYYMFRTKGFFTHLTIGEGITKIGKWAFTNRIDPNLPGIDAIKELPIVLSHLTSVKLGDDLEEIGYESFYDNVSLTEVIGGANLNFIDKRPFAGIFGGINLTTVDFTRCNKLNSIPQNAFAGCKKLSYLGLPPGLWKTSAGLNLYNYFPYDMTPERIAYVFANSDKDAGGSWQKTKLSTSPVYYTKTANKDSLGKFIDVKGTTDIETAIKKVADEGEIYISEGYKGEHTIDLNGRTASMTINVAPQFKDFTIKNKGSSDITVKKGECLMLNNVKPEGKIQLGANYDPSSGRITNTAGFAIKGVDSSDIPQVSIVEYSDQGEVGETIHENVLSTEANINNETYDAYGIFNFAIKDDDDGKGEYNYIYDTSPFGDRATSITYAHQIEGIERVKVNNGTTSNNHVTHITFTSDVESIAEKAFNNFDKIQEVTCEEGLTTIGASAFNDCDGLTSVTLPNSVETIGDKAFNSCNNLTIINIPTSLKAIPAECFHGCPKIESIDIPNSVTSIGKEAFKGCTGLFYVEFPIGLESIGESAFSDCSSLYRISIPDESKLYKIEKNAFLNCAILTYAYFGESATKGWKVPDDSEGTISIDEDILADPGQAAILLKNKTETEVGFADKEWTREAPNL
ncbi:MAG: leucine-rich repeat domain-containing protein [Bacilli bacterium]|nr:leucine-rich repeat domain-containing protein [Bacilli bacterium]